MMQNLVIAAFDSFSGDANLQDTIYDREDYGRSATIGRALQLGQKPDDEFNIVEAAFLRFAR